RDLLHHRERLGVDADQHRVLLTAVPQRARAVGHAAAPRVAAGARQRLPGLRHRADAPGAADRTEPRPPHRADRDAVARDPGAGPDLNRERLAIDPDQPRPTGLDAPEVPVTVHRAAVEPDRARDLGHAHGLLDHARLAVEQQHLRGAAAV